MYSLGLLFVLAVVVQQKQYIVHDSNKVSQTAVTYDPAKDDINKCICDTNLNICDKHCCCDPKCPSDITKMWNIYKQCSNVVYSSKKKYIVECSQVKKSLKDIGSGLNFFLKIFQKLICISKANRKNYDIRTSKSLKNFADLKKELSISRSVENIIVMDKDSQYYRIVRSKIGENGICGLKSVHYLQNYGLEQCHVLFNNIQNICKSQSLIDPAYYIKQLKTSLNTSIIQNPTINLYKIDSSDKIVSTQLKTSLPAINYVSSGCKCQNYLSQMILRVKSSQTEIGKLESAEIDVIIRQEDQFVCNSQGSVQVGTKVDWISNENQNGLVGNNPLGYKQRDLVIIGKEYVHDSNTKLVIYQSPFKLNAIDPATGYCYYQSSNSELKQVFADQYQIRFMEDQIISCSYSINKLVASGQAKNNMQLFCDNIYKFNLLVNFINQIKYIGTYKRADQNRIEDWTKVISQIQLDSLPSSTQQDNICIFYYPRLIVYYTKIGSRDGHQYRILEAQIIREIQQVSYYHLDPKLNQIVNVKVTVNFVEVPNSAIFYTAPIPSPNVRFENDVLYPFYEAK